MKLYFKHEAESDLGSGTAYMEVTNGWPSRQVEVYGDNWRWGDETCDQFLADQPLEVLELGFEHVIPPEEFERVWKEAQTRCPRPS